MATDPTTGVDSSLPTGKVTTNIPSVGDKTASSSDAKPGSWNPQAPAPSMKPSPVFDVANTGNDPGKGGARGGMEGPSNGPVGGASGHEIY